MDASSNRTDAARISNSGWSHGTRAFRHRNYRTFWFGALISNSGTWLQNLTIPYVLLQLTDQAAWVGISTFAALMPVMLLSPIAGNIADRFDRRRVLILGQSAAALGAILLAVVWAVGIRDPYAIVAFTAVAGALNSLNAPVWQSFVVSLVPVEDLPSAISLNSLQFNLARAVGPAIGGATISFLGPAWAFSINALSFLGVLAALFFLDTGTIRRAKPSGRPVQGGMSETLAYIRAHPGIGRSITLACLVAFLGFPVTGFVVIYAQQVYAVSAGTVGVLSALIGIGALGAAPIVSGMFGDLSRATTIRIALPGYGAALLLFGTSRHPLQGAIGLLCVGIGFLTIVATTNTALQTIVADRIRGRVMAFRIMLFTGAYPLGALIQTQLADRSNPRLIVTIAASIVTVLGIVAFFQPRWCHPLDDPPDDDE